MFLTAQVVGGGFSIVQWAIFIVLIAAVFALVMVALRKFGVVIPDFAVQCFWIVIVAFVVIGAIILLARFAGMA